MREESAEFQKLCLPNENIKIVDFELNINTQLSMTKQKDSSKDENKEKEYFEFFIKCHKCVLDSFQILPINQRKIQLYKALYVG